MKLLYCSRDYTAHDLRFVRAFIAGGFDVAYVRLEDDGVPYVADPLPAGSRWVKWKGGGEPRRIPQAIELLGADFGRVVAEETPDVVHAGPITSFGYLAARVGAPRTVLVSWGSDILVDATRDAWSAHAATAATKHAEAFVCDNNAVLDAMTRLRGGPTPPHVCAPWGLERVPPPRDPGVASSVRERLGWRDAVVVISTRAWHHGYRIPRLVEAFALAAARDARLRLLLAGTGEDAPVLERMLARNELRERVHRTGMLGGDELQETLSSADIYLSLVPSDGTSISLLEAMSHALPPIVSRNVGNAEWVVDGETGFLVDADDVGAVADRVLMLASNPRDAARIGANARSVVEARADWQKTSDRLATLYRAIARGEATAR